MAKKESKTASQLLDEAAAHLEVANSAFAGHERLVVASNAGIGGIYAQMVAAMKDFATTGLSKSRENKQQGFKFRGIDDLMNLAAPILAKHSILVFPTVLSRTVETRTTRNDSLMFNVALIVEFTFVSALDGSRHVATLAGEAQDSSDKATNKAMSAAFKYAMLQSFCIPLEGEGEDADATTPEPSVVPKPVGFDVVKSEASAAAMKGVFALREYAKSLVAPATEAWAHLVKHDPGYKDIKAVAESVDAKALGQQLSAERIAADVKNTGTRVPGEEG